MTKPKPRDRPVSRSFMTMHWITETCDTRTIEREHVDTSQMTERQARASVAQRIRCERRADQEREASIEDGTWIESRGSKEFRHEHTRKRIKKEMGP